MTHSSLIYVAILGAVSAYACKATPGPGVPEAPERGDHAGADLESNNEDALDPSTEDNTEENETDDSEKPSREIPTPPDMMPGPGQENGSEMKPTPLPDGTAPKPMDPLPPKVPSEMPPPEKPVDPIVKLPDPTPPDPNLLSEGLYHIVGAASGLCLGVPVNDGYAYALVLADCSGRSNPVSFRLKKLESGAYAIYSPHLRIVELRDGKAGSLIHQGNVHEGKASQTFVFEQQVDKKTFLIKLASLNLAIEVSGAGTLPGSMMVGSSLSGSAHQRWELKRISD